MHKEKKFFSLSIILKRVKQILNEKIEDKRFWIKTEIANVNFHKSGHCYLDLTETKNNQPIAKCRATIWKSNLKSIEIEIGKDIHNILKKGNEVLCFIKISFSEIYGLQINILDVDINFNLGNLELKKQQTIKRLTDEKLNDKNKQHVLPTVIQKIAIIGAPNTAGYTDFIKHLKENEYKYVFEIDTYSSLVQGENAENQIISRLKELNNKKYHIIAIIRGGGSKLDLEVFNSYNISKEIALHKLPILTGIGHETDYSVVDIVANMHHKAPSALAAFIINRARNYENRVITTFTAIQELKNKILEDKKAQLELNIQTLTSLAVRKTGLKRGDLHSILTRINTISIEKINTKKNRISLAIENIKVLPLSLVSEKSNTILHKVEIIRLNSSRKIKIAIDTHKNIFELIQTNSIKNIKTQQEIHKNKFDLAKIYINNLISTNKTKIENTKNIIGVFHPSSILRKGYGIPRYNSLLLSKQTLAPNDIIEIELYNRKLITKFVKEVKWKT